MANVEYIPYTNSETSEHSIRIFLNGNAVAVSQGSPYSLKELAVGYLLSEGLITNRDSLSEVRADAQNSEVHVFSDENLTEGYVPLTRVTSAGCAKSALLSEKDCVPTLSALNSSVAFSADDILVCLEELCERSPRRNTGECVHGCGLLGAQSNKLLLVREDIGRHNAMDKLVGQAWLDRIDVRDKALLITGRISAEMALKAYRAGSPVLVSRKSVTGEAVNLASELGVTLVSHGRNDSLRVLTCHERITN